MQCDISKYFDSINHKILFEILQKKIADRRVLWLIKEVIESNGFETGKGIPIGNLTSQLFANVYLNELDHFVKRILRHRYYLRYMDDFLILGADKRELWRTKCKIAEFLKTGLDLNLHPKKANVLLARTGIEFLGFRIFEDYRLLRKSTVKRFVKKIKSKKGDETTTLLPFNSFCAFANQAHCWQILQNMERKILPRRREERIINRVNAELQIIDRGNWVCNN